MNFIICPWNFPPETINEKVEYNMKKVLIVLLIGCSVSLFSQTMKVTKIETNPKNYQVYASEIQMPKIVDYKVIEFRPKSYPIADEFVLYLDHLKLISTSNEQILELINYIRNTEEYLDHFKFLNHDENECHLYKMINKGVLRCY